MNQTDYDVAIVGAGPAGSSAAVALSQKGWRVLLLEQDTFPRHKVCGEFLSPEAQISLRSLGLYENVSTLSPVSLHHAVVTSPRGQQVHVELSASAWGISRFALDDALATAARNHGATVWTGVAVSDYSESDDGYLLALDHGVSSTAQHLPATVSARTLILASGRHSRLTAACANRRAMRRHRGLRRQRYVGVKCHFDGAVVSDEIRLFFFSGGYGGINSVENGRANLCLLATYEAFQTAGKRPTAIIDVLRERHPELARQLNNAGLVPETLKTIAAVDTARPATPWQGAPCIGDAAAMITPLCGDGMAMALSASELCVPLADAYLRGQISRTEWAQTYSSAWHSAFARRIVVGRLLQDALATPLLADLLIGMGRLTPPLTSHLFAATRGDLVVHTG